MKQGGAPCVSLSALFYRDSEVVLVALVKRPQRLTMLEGLMQWDDRNSESYLPASCVTEYWCKITRQQIILLVFFILAALKRERMIWIMTWLAV